jgi:very-short-patch-repair endonuclease
MENSHLTPYAKKLRSGATNAENHLWQRLRARQMEGCKFRRQQPIDCYIVDFVCFENKLVVELDGGQHAARQPEDQKRDRFLELNRFKVLRFWNNEVFENLEGVLEVIRKACLSASSPSPGPSRQGRGG